MPPLPLLAPPLGATHFFSSAAVSVTMPPGVIVMLFCQVLKPAFWTEIVHSPGGSRTVEGVLPKNLPSTLISPPSGSDFRTRVASSPAALSASICGLAGAASGGGSGGKKIPQSTGV